MKYNPVGIGDIELNTIVLDLNGTLAVHGKLVEGAKERVEKLKEMGYKIYLYTGDQRGNAAMYAQEIGIEVKKATTSDEKKLFLDY